MPDDSGDMSAQFPDPEMVRAVLTLATQAPSVHNSQPWRWRVGPHSLHLHADPSRHLPKTDPDRRDLVVSCGAVLHHCAVALAAMGWQAKIHRFPNPADRNHLASIEVHRQSAGRTRHRARGRDRPTPHGSSQLQLVASAQR